MGSGQFGLCLGRKSVIARIYRPFFSLLAVSSVFVWTQSSTAETVSILPPQSASSQVYDLTTQGQTDWLKWGGSSASTVYRKELGGSLIGSFVRIDTNDYPTSFDSTSTGNAHTGFFWDDGDSTTQSSSSNQFGAVIFTPDPSGSTFGTGFQFTAFPGAGSGTLRFWGMSASADALLSVSLKNSSNVVLASDSNSTFTNPGGIFGFNYESAYYDITFSGLQSSDKIVVQYSVAKDNGNDGTGHGYVGLMAAALNVAPAPEPSSLWLIAIAGFGLLARRRRI